MSFLSASISKLETSKSQMQQINVDRIHLDPMNDTLYPRFDPENCEEDRDLIESIREAGLLQPLCVRRHEQLPDEHIVIAGHRRLQACKVVGIKKVECLILSAATEEDKITLKMDLVLSNRTRDRSNPAIQAKEVAYLENLMRNLKKINPEHFKGLTIRSIVANELGISQRTVASVEKINNNLDPATYKAFIEGDLTQKQALIKADEAMVAGGKKKAKRLEGKASNDTDLTARQIELGEIYIEDVQRCTCSPDSTDKGQGVEEQYLHIFEELEAKILDNPKLLLCKEIQDAIRILKQAICTQAKISATA